jgi:hypothetical protein
MKPNASSFALLSLMLFGEVQGFCPQAQHTRSSSTSLNLLPGQGNQLAAAYTAFISHKNNDDETDTVTPATKPQEPPSSSSHWRALAASRSFVSRVFHLPSSAIKKHPHPTLEGLKANNDKKESNSFPFGFIPTRHHREEEDAVLYPLVGFQFVKSQEGSNIKTIALPTTSHAACRLPTHRNEPVFGWYSPACKLDLYSEDVCHAPVCDETDTEQL